LTHISLRWEQSDEGRSIAAKRGGKKRPKSQAGVGKLKGNLIRLVVREAFRLLITWREKPKDATQPLPSLNARRDGDFNRLAGVLMYGDASADLTRYCREFLSQLNTLRRHYSGSGKPT
jgi:hypothetical protein